MSDPIFMPMRGDCISLMQELEENSVDAIPTDPPYGIGFMGRKWDTFKPGVETKRIVEARTSTNPNVVGRSRSPASSPSAVEYDRTLVGQRAFQDWTAKWAREALRVLKPGGYMAVFGAPRSHHRMMCGLEDAGFEVRDCLMWLFGKGFPKSLNLGNGVGTALKPAWEPIALVRKPLGRLTVTKCHEMYGTGGLQIDDCRIATNGESFRAPQSDPARRKGIVGTDLGITRAGKERFQEAQRASILRTQDLGRWPTDLLLDEDAAALLGPESRFFYCSKVSTREREYGCEDLPARTPGEMTGGRKDGSKGLNNPRAGAGRTSGSHNAHPTVKPIALMRWLVRLITPEGGLVLDPFVGSGTTAIAATLEGHEVIGMDREREWLAVAEARVNAWLARERK